MAQVHIGGAIGAGFGLMRRHPLSVLVWGALPIALQVATFVLFAPVFIAFYAPYVTAAQTHTLPAAPAALPPQFMQAYLWLQLLNLVQGVVGVVVNCAVFRAVLHPEKSAFAYLRLGVAELLVFALLFMALIAFFVIALIVMIPVGVMVGLMVGLSHGAGASIGFALILPLVMLAMVFAIFFFALRFALAGPMIVDDGKFHLFDAWIITRGHFWSLFAIALSLFAIVVVAELLFFAFAIAAGAAGLAAVAGGFANLQALFALPPTQLLARVAPILAVYLVVAMPFFGVVFAVLAAPWAQILRDLKPAAASEAFA